MSFPWDLNLSGTAAARPAAADTNKGKLYFATDTKILYLSDGATWTQLAPASDLVSGLVRIAQTVVGVGGVTDITFSSIPATYENLRLSLMGRCDKAGSTEIEVRAQFNGDTGNNYDSLLFVNLGTSHNQYETLAAAYMFWGSIPAATGAANSSGLIEVVLGAYARTVFHKNFISENSHRLAYSSGNHRGIFTTGNWRSTAAINAIKLYPASDKFIEGTVATLYGVL